MAPIVELKNISKVYRMGEVEVHALRGVSLSIESGEFVAIMGPSGSGKSTLLHILGFLDRPDAGEYIISGRDISKLSDNELATLRNRLLGFVFQQFHLLKRVSAIDNVKLPFIYGKDSKDIRAAAQDKIRSVGLEDRASHWPNELSGGQQQRVAIARALVKEPMIIFADEPTGNLDSVSEHEIMHILKGLNAEGKTIIMVTHEQEISEYAGRVIAMRDGKIVSDEKRRPSAAGAEARCDLNKILSKKRSVWQRGELFGHLHQAVKSVLSNKVRSFLSMLGILVGVASVIAMLALGEGATSAMRENLKSLGSNLLSVRAGSARIRGAASGAGAITRFTFDDIEAIQALKPDVRKVSGIISGSAQIVYKNENWNTRIEGVGVDYGEMRAAVPQTGRWFTEEEIKRREKVAVIGITVLEKLFGEENPVNKTIKINRVNFRIIGITPQKGFGGFRDQDDIIYIPVTTAMYRVLGKNYLEGIYVEVSEQDVMDE
ncbi:MAG: ABC transporter permease, partial [bacterium]|nr:ABC transporter permease [bacterium]